MVEVIQNLTQQIQEQVMKSTKTSTRTRSATSWDKCRTAAPSCMNYWSSFPREENARKQPEELVASYEAIESSLKEVAQHKGVAEAVN